MSDSIPSNQPKRDVQADYVDYLKSLLASIGPGRGYVSLNKTPAGRAKAIANKKNTEDAWDEAFIVSGAYQLFLDCIVAVQHIDPMTLDVPDTVPSNQVHIYRNLLSVDIARSSESLPLPLPPKDWQGFYDRVRKLFVDVVVSRLALDQIDRFIDQLMSDIKISRVLDRKTVDQVIRKYASQHPRYDGYYDLSDTEAITRAIDGQSTSIELLRADSRYAVMVAQRNLLADAFPSRSDLLFLIKERKMTSANFHELLKNRWRTTHDLLARSDT